MDDQSTPITVADPFARYLMAQYLKRREEELAQLNASLADADFESIVLTAHKLFGSGAAYGLDEISRLGGALESAAESRHAARVAALLAELERYLQHVKLV